MVSENLKIAAFLPLALLYVALVVMDKKEERKSRLIQITAPHYAPDGLTSYRVLDYDGDRDADAILDKNTLEAISVAADMAETLESNSLWGITSETPHMTEEEQSKGDKALKEFYRVNFREFL